jgi:hypothetical protein
MTVSEEVVFKATATDIPCDDITVDTTNQRCVNVLITITASVNTGFDPAAAAAMTEASIQEGTYATVLEEISGVVATVALPPSEKPSSFPSSSPSTSIEPS